MKTPGHRVLPASIFAKVTTLKPLMVRRIPN